MMDLQSFSAGQLQDSMAVLQLFSRSGQTDIAEVIRILHRELLVQLAKNQQDYDVLAGRRGGEVLYCPSCGNGMLTPVINPDGLPIVGCKTCRYSEVIDVAR